MRSYYTPSMHGQSEPENHRSPASVLPAQGSASGSEHRGAHCACGGVCPRCADKLQGDFSNVRLHPNAPEVTTPLQARAVTRGRDVYFHPGQFQPGTLEGRSLIAHELAHTLQTRGSENDASSPAGYTSKPGDALEKNASALAHGQTAHALTAPAGAALCSPFDSESADDRARREQLLEAINNAENNLIRVLRTGGLVDRTEVTATRGGTRGVVVPPDAINTPQETFLSYADRDTMIRRIIRNLMAMATQYRRTPIGPDLPSSVQESTQPPHFTTTITVPDGSSSYGGRNPVWSQLQAAYELYRISQGQTGDAYELDWYYLSPDLTISPGAARGAPRISGGVESGAYMVVPDIEHEPLRYWRLTGSSPTPRGSVIVEFWHDDLGYYYMNHGQRIDVPNPWSR